MSAALFVLVSLSLLGVCGLGLVLFQTRRQLSDLRQQFDRQGKQINSGVYAMGRRILELEGRIASLREASEEASGSEEDHAYTRARQLLDDGLDEDVVAQSTGLSLAEVKLMKMVHHRPQTEGVGQ